METTNLTGKAIKSQIVDTKRQIREITAAMSILNAKAHAAAIVILSQHLCETNTKLKALENIEYMEVKEDDTDDGE